MRDRILTILRWLGIFSVVAFSLSVFTPMWNVIGQKLAVAPDLQRADAVVVLGSAINADGTLNDESLRRTAHGMELYKGGLAPLLLVSGSTLPNGMGPSEAEVRRDLAVRMGIPDERIILFPNVLTTRDESRQVAAELERRHAGSILLVTESLHMRRAMRLFERVGLKVFPAPSDNQPQAASYPDDRLLLMRTILEQGGALVYYRIAGYI